MIQKVTIQLISLLIFQTFLALGSPVFTQEINGLQNERNTNRATKIAAIDSLNKAAFAVFRTDPAKTKSLALQALQNSKTINYQTGEGKALNYIGMTFHLAGDYDSASGYYKKSLEIFGPLNDSIYLGKVYNNLSFLYSDQEYFNLALEYSFRSLEISKALKDSVNLLNTYNNIGISYIGLVRYDQAMKYFRAMLNITDVIANQEESYFTALANIGIIHIYQSNYDSAAVCLKNVIQFDQTVKDNFGLEQTWSFLGLMYAKTSKPDSAIRALAESDRYATLLDDKKMLATNGCQLAELYYETGNFVGARAQFEKVLNLARQNNFLKIEMDSYFYLAKLDSINLYPAGAFEKYKAGVMIRDSLNSISVRKQIAELDIQYESLQKNQEISHLRQDKEIQDLKMKRHLGQRNMLLIILLVFISFVGFAFISLRKIRIANILLARQNEEIAVKNVILLKHEEQLEEMVAERTIELVAAKEKAEESDRLKSAFLANMSHEIRTPLNGILGFMDLLQEKDLSEEDQDDYFRIIRKSSDRLLDTINNIVDFSKIEAGQILVNLSDFDFAEQLRSLHDFFIPEALRKGLQLEIGAGQKDAPMIIRSDRDKLNAIITNLIKNAIKFTNQGVISMGWQVQDGVLDFYVSDTGIGIPADRLKSVFDRFIQIYSPMNQSFEGSGLGLAITKAYVEILGGTIEVESELDRGSVFRIRIPC